MTSRSKADEKVQVAVRCRPMNQSERNSRVKKAVECNVKSREINVVTGTTAMGLSSSQQTKVYNFDKVFAPNATQFDVYKNVVESQLQDVLAGYNCTVLAYGQTGTGKTYTMEGERTVDEEFAWDTDPRAGIIPRALSQLFDCLEKAGCEFSVRVSLLEIYNEEIYDLLSHSSDLIKMRIYEDNHRKGSVVVSGLTEVHVRHKNEVYDIIQQGAMKRRTAATNLNEFSSRSHSVFSVTVHTKDISQNQMEEEELVKIGKLNLVDLAGSENIGRSGAVDKRAREAGNINQSLLTLGRCITALVDRAPHIPYRESKLTRLLQDSLGGSTKTSIIATISPGSDNLEETLSTLDYAARAKNIHNKPKVNQKLTKRALIKEYDDEIERLRREVIALREKNGVYVDPKRYEEMVSQIESLTAIVKQREEDVEKFQELFSQASAELSERTEKLHILHDDLMQTSKELAEQCHLKVAYMEHGTKVQDHAAELLNTANVVTEDIKKVHDKVDRVTRIQKTNMDTFGSFSGRIKENLGQLCSGTVSVLDKNKASLQETVSNLNNFGDEQNKMLDMLLTQINEWHAFMQSASQETSRSQKSLNDEMSTLVEDNRAKLEDQKVRIESKMNKHEERMKKLDDFAGSMTTLISDIKDNVASQRAQMIEQVALTLDHHQKIKGYVDRVKNTTARVLSVQEAQSQAALNNQKILMEQMQNDMRSRMEAMCKDINEGLQESIEDVEAIGQVASDFNDDVTCSVDRFDTELTEKEEKIVASVEETVGGITRCYSDGMEDMVEMQAVVDANHDVASSFCQSVKKGVSSGVGKCNDQLRVADESSSNFHKDACSVVGDTNQHRLTFIDDLLQQITSVKEKLFETGSSLQDNVESITHEVNDCYAEKLQRVVSTGETPAKKIYKYCQQIPNLPVEEEVLTNFREKIHESQEEDNEMQTEEEEVESKSDSETSSIEVNQSITIPDSGGIPFFKKKKQKSRLAKIHSTGTTKQPLSRVPFRAMQNTD